MASNDEWLALVEEATIEPGLPICDCHHHLWPNRRYGVEKRYLWDDFLKDAGSGHNIRSSVYITSGTSFRRDGVEAYRCVGEVEFANGQAAIAASGDFGDLRIADAIVGTAYLRAGAAAGDVLDALRDAARGRFRGIREGANWHADPEIPNHRTGPPANLYGDVRFREGFAELAHRDLCFEALCYHTQLDELTALAQAFPDTRIVLNHFGVPLGIGRYAGRRAEVLAQWRPAIKRLSTCNNVFAKLGGINMEINGYEWHKKGKPPSSQELMEATRPFYEYTIESFGVNRCMFESNFPVDKASVSYNVLWNSFKRLVTGYSTAEKSRLFHASASEFYRIADWS